LPSIFVISHAQNNKINHASLTSTIEIIDFKASDLGRRLAA